MTEITQTVAGRIHSVILAPVTAYVVMQVADTFLGTFVPRREAENLRVGYDVITSPSDVGIKFYPACVCPQLPRGGWTPHQPPRPAACFF